MSTHLYRVESVKKIRVESKQLCHTHSCLGDPWRHPLWWCLEASVMEHGAKHSLISIRIKKMVRKLELEKTKNIYYIYSWMMGGWVWVWNGCNVEWWWWRRNLTSSLMFDSVMIVYSSIASYFLMFILNPKSTNEKQNSQCMQLPAFVCCTYLSMKRRFAWVHACLMWRTECNCSCVCWWMWNARWWRGLIVWWYWL